MFVFVMILHLRTACFTRETDSYHGLFLVLNYYSFIRCQKLNFCLFMNVFIRLFIKTVYQTNVLIWDTDSYYCLLLNDRTHLNPQTKQKLDPGVSVMTGSSIQVKWITPVSRNEQQALSSGKDQSLSTALTQYLLQRFWWRFCKPTRTLSCPIT